MLNSNSFSPLLRYWGASMRDLSDPHMQRLVQQFRRYISYRQWAQEAATDIKARGSWYRPGAPVLFNPTWEEIELCLAAANLQGLANEDPTDPPAVAP